MDRFEAISVFVAVADQRGFAPAARRLGVSTSAATRHVAALEERLGVRLLNRTTRAVSLTDAGQRFLDRARRILADLEEAELMAESERGEPSGRIVVAAPNVFGKVHIGPLICEYLTANPKLRAELLLSDRIINLVEEGVDVALRIGNLGDSGDIARRVGAVRRVLVASPAYLESAGTPNDPASLGGHRLISFVPLTAPSNWRFFRGGAAEEVNVAATYVTNSAEAAIWHAVNGGGITMALSYQVVDQVKSGALRPILIDYEPPPYPVQFVYPSSRLLSVKVRKLIDLASATRDWDFLTFER